MLKYHHMKIIIYAIGFFIALALVNRFFGGTPF
jgi:hypothetical protein